MDSDGATEGSETTTGTSTSSLSLSSSSASSSSSSEKRWRELVDMVLEPTSAISLQTLLDLLVSTYQECKGLDAYHLMPPIKKFVDRYEPIVEEVNAMRLNIQHFHVIKLLGRGAFGEVNLCQSKLDGVYYAIKKLAKSEMLMRQEAFYMEERDLLGLGQGVWITSLKYAFQDSEYLYLVMEYLAGGNMLNLLYKQENEVFDEDTARFYIAETVMGVHEIHELGFAYRDLKPDNMMLDRTGHIKLTDFGSCARVDEDGFVSSEIPVGTPYYIAPEVLQAQDPNFDGKCGRESDWWTVGIVLYEMLLGDPPFFSESNLEIYGMVMNHKENLKFPADRPISENAKSLIKGLICDRHNRLTFEQIKSHAFFQSIDWENLRSMTPPFVPALSGPDDTSQFEDDFDSLEPQKAKKAFSKKKNMTGDNLPFIGYTFTRSIPKFVPADQVVATPLSPTTASAPTSSSSSSHTASSKSKGSDVEKYQQKLKEEKSRSSQLESEKNGLLSDLKKKEDSLAAEMKLRREAEDEKLRLEREKRLQDIELKQVQDKYAAELKNKEQSELRIQDLKASVEKLAGENKQLESTLSSREKHQREIDLLKSKLEEQNAQIREHVSTIEQGMQKKVFLESQLQAANERLDKETALCSNLEGQIRDLRRAVTESAAKEAALVITAERQSKEIDKYQNELRLAKEQLEEESSRLRKTIAELHEAKAAEEQRAEELQMKFSRQERHGSALEMRLENFEKSMERRRASGTESVDNSDSGELEEMQAQFSLQKDVLQQREEELQAMISEKAAANKEIATLKNKLADEQSEHDATKKKLVRTESLFAKKMEEESAVAEKILQLQQERDQLLAEKTSHEADMSNVENLLKQETLRISALQAARAELESTKETLEAKYQSSKKTMEEQTEKIKSLEEQVYSLNSRLNDQLSAEQNSSLLQEKILQAEALEKQLAEEKRLIVEQEDMMNRLKKEIAAQDFDFSELEKKYLAEVEQAAAWKQQLKELKSDFTTKSQELQTVTKPTVSQPTTTKTNNG